MIIDLHCDTIQKAKDENLELNSRQLDFNLKDVQKYLPYVQCLATFINTKYNGGDNGFKRAISIIDNFYIQYELNKEKINIIRWIFDCSYVFFHGTYDVELAGSCIF